MQNVTPNDMGTRSSLAIVGIFTALVLAIAAFFVVPAGEVGVITTLGKVSDAPRLPGLNIKTPFVQSVHYFNVRTQVRPEEFSSLTKDLQVIEATATVKYAVKPLQAPRVYSTISTGNEGIYARIIQPSLLKSLKSVFSKYELVEIATIGTRSHPLLSRALPKSWKNSTTWRSRVLTSPA